MDEIVKNINKSYVLKRMNNIRLYLKVSRLSDIATSTGDGIRQDVFDGIPLGESTLDWPKQRKPIQQNLNTWKKVLIEIFQATTGLKKN